MAALPLRDLLKALITKAGGDITDVKYAKILSVSEEIEDGQPLADFLNGAMTLEAAKNNSTLEAHFKGKALSPIEGELKKLMDEYGLDDAAKAEILADPSTYKKLPALLKKVADLKDAKAAAAPADKKALQDKITELNQSILAVKADFESQLKAADLKAENQILDFAIAAELGSKTYSDAIPEGIRLSGANELLKKELAAKGLKAIRTSDNKIKLVQAANPDLTYMENNKEVVFGDFATSAVRPMLKVSDAPPPNADPARKIITDPKVNKGAQKVSDFNLEQAKRFEDNSKLVAA